MDDQTRCVTKSTVSFRGYESLTTPICRASTIRFPNAAAYGARHSRDVDGYIYGLYGTPTHRFLEKTLTDLEQGARTVLVPSGQAAIALPILALVPAGGKILLPDSVYPPVRDFAENELSALNVEVQFYDPTDLLDLQSRIDRTTDLVWIESPGSTTMEFQDVGEIARIAHANGALVGCDNSWATPLLFKPLQHGADIVVEALSKYISGHSDILMGSVTTSDEVLGQKIKAAAGRMGLGTSPDDCGLVLRGLETLYIRLEKSQASALKVARWIAAQAVTKQVLHPALPSCPGHALWKRDFSGASGVFSVLLEEAALPHLSHAFDVLESFSIGASWGGTKSLMVPMPVESDHRSKTWQGPDIVLRLSIGLEQTDVLTTDLARFFGELDQRMARGADAGLTSARLG